MKPKASRARGRPSSYAAAIAATICERIGDGESLRRICRDEAMPHRVTVLRWLADDAHADFRTQYARARQMQADKLADEILEIADDSSADKKTIEIGEGVTAETVDHEHIQRSRLRVDARKWLAGKLAPRKYGERVELGAVEGDPIAAFFAGLAKTILRPADDQDEGGGS